MLPPPASVLRALGFAAGGWLLLGILRTSLRVAAKPRPPAEAVAVFGQVLLASLPWLLAAPAIVVLASRLPWRRGRRRLTLGAHLAAAVALSLTDAAWAWTVLPLAGYSMTLPPEVFYLVRLDQTLFLYLCLVGIGLALRHRRRLEEATGRAARLEARLLAARLHTLELQLHPHFLFNTLNAVSELVHRDAPAARAVLASLRELLARSLDPGVGQEIPLRDELTLLEAYLRIQRTRFAGALNVVVDADPATLDAMVPRLALQPLVENAIRHGTARRAGPGRVAIRTRSARGRLLIEIEDDGPGLGPGPAREGLGLGNTRARLAQLHGGHASLTLAPGRRRGAVARLECPLRGAVAVPGGTDEIEDAATGASALEGRPISLARVALGAALAWLLAALVGAHADFAAARLSGDAASLAALLPARLLEANLWLGFTGPVLAVATGLARTPVGWPVRIGTHLVAALATIGAHLALVRALSNTAMDGNLVATLLVNGLCVYAAVAASAHAWTVRESAASRLAAAARLEAELAAARLEQLHWRIRPDILFGALDRIALLATDDPERADTLTGRLGELLRLLLQRRGGGFAGPEAVELSEVYLEVERAARSVA